MFVAILILLVLPFTDTSDIKGSSYNPLYTIAFWIFALNFIVLMWLGSCHVEAPFVVAGQIATAYYFSHFLIILPVFGIINNVLGSLGINWNASILQKENKNENKSKSLSKDLNLSVSMLAPALYMEETLERNPSSDALYSIEIHESDKYGLGSSWGGCGDVPEFLLDRDFYHTGCGEIRNWCEPINFSTPAYVPTYITILTCCLGFWFASSMIKKYKKRKNTHAIGPQISALNAPETQTRSPSPTHGTNGETEVRPATPEVVPVPDPNARFRPPRLIRTPESRTPGWIEDTHGYRRYIRDVESHIGSRYYRLFLDPRIPWANQPGVVDGNQVNIGRWSDIPVQGYDTDGLWERIPRIRRADSAIRRLTEQTNGGNYHDFFGTRPAGGEYYEFVRNGSTLTPIVGIETGTSQGSGNVTGGNQGGGRAA